MHKEIITRIAIIILCILFFSFKARDISSQFTGDENFYFQSSKNMLESGDWLTPRYYSKPRFQKPVLYYWLVALSFRIFGINWFAARFPSILLATFTVLLVYLIGRILFKDLHLSLLSAFILAATFKFFKYARFAIPDMALAFFITLSFYIFIKLLDENRRPLWMVFFLSLSLATLIKGPIGIIIPILSIAVFTLLFKERIAIKKADVLLGVLLCVAISLPWFLAMFKIHGEDFISHLWSREIAHRVRYYSDTKQGMEVFIEYLGSLFFYIPILIIRFLPWSIFLPKGIFNSLSIAKSATSEGRVLRLLLSWFFTVFVFFTLIGEKHSQYMLLLSAPFALLVGVGFSQRLEFSKKRLTIPIVLLFFTAFSFLFFLTNEDLRLNNAILGGFASKILAYGLEEDGRIGMGSHGLIPQHLEVYLDRPVEKVGGKWYDPSYHEHTNRIQLENFFKRKGRPFCIIRREDYLKYISSTLKKRLNIIHKDYLWKRKIEFTKDKFTLLFKGRIKSFIDSFKEEYYLVVAQ